jgi:hypothetical protein
MHKDFIEGRCIYKVATAEGKPVKYSGNRDHRVLQKANLFQKPPIEVQGVLTRTSPLHSVFLSHTTTILFSFYKGEQGQHNSTFTYHIIKEHVTMF